MYFTNCSGFVMKLFQTTSMAILTPSFSASGMRLADLRLRALPALLEGHVLVRRRRGRAGRCRRRRAWRLRVPPSRAARPFGPHLRHPGDESVLVPVDRVDHAVDQDAGLVAGADGFVLVHVAGLSISTPWKPSYLISSNLSSIEPALGADHAVLDGVLQLRLASRPISARRRAAADAASAADVAEKGSPRDRVMSDHLRDAGHRRPAASASDAAMSSFAGMRFSFEFRPVPR